MSRIPDLTEADLDPAQRRVFERIVSGRRAAARETGSMLGPGGGLRGPFDPWLRSPELADLAQALGERIRFEATLPGPLRELAILLVAARWRAQYEWWAHERIARAAGLDEGVIAAVKAGRRPDFGGDEAAGAVHDFAAELLDTRRVGEGRYRAALAALGERGVVELVMTLGYYTLVSMTLNAFEVPLPDGETPPFEE